MFFGGLAEEVDRGISAVQYLRKQQSVQHLPDRAEVDAGGKAGGYVSTFITKAQVIKEVEIDLLHYTSLTA